MISTINSDLIRGNINTIILKSLFEGDRYGYDIVKEIEQKSSGQYKLKQPTLYSCLKRLEVQGFIRSYWGAKSNGGRRKYYTLTDMGKELFIKNQTEWEYSRTVIDKLISNKEYDLSKLEQTETNADFIESDNDAGTDIDEEYAVESDSDSDSETEESDYIDSLKEFFSATGPDENTIFDTISQDTVVTSSPLKSETVEHNENLQDAQSNIDSSKNDSDVDISSLIDKLFSEQKNEKSYTDNLIDERYISKNAKTFNSDMYFNDFTDADAEKFGSDELNIVQAPKITEAPVKAAKAEPEKNTSVIADTDVAEPQKNDKSFIGYNSPSQSNKSDNKNILERDYKNILSQLISSGLQPDANITKAKNEQAFQLAPQIPVTEHMQLNNEIVEKRSFPEPPSPPQFSQKETELTQNLIKIAESSRVSTGDNLKTRIHDSRTDSAYRTQFHYYSNKLMLVHYAILFGIMMLEIIFTFLLARVGLKIYRDADKYFYLFSVLLAVAFPLTAAVLNFRDSNKTKRYEFDLKNSLSFRIWITAACLIITYCLNIYMRMPMSFSSSYLATLLLPALLSLSFPISAIIFYYLNKTNKFNQR